MIITLKLHSAFATNNSKDNDWYRIIEIDSESDLETLHLVIQEALDFDNDHLYEFFTANTIASSQKIRFDHDNEGIWDYSVGSLFPLAKHKKLFYLFDYGDSWYFRISKTRKRAEPKEKNVDYPRIVESIGEDPKQYPDYDDDFE